MDRENIFGQAFGQGNFFGQAFGQGIFFGQANFLSFDILNLNNMCWVI
jgi:hypothetical protein